MTARDPFPRVLRITAGAALVLHGLAHAVFASRGASGEQLTFAGAHAVLAAYSTALVLFVAAGTGLIGSRLLYPLRVPLMTVALVASIVALALDWQPDLWFGAAGDVVIAGWLLLAPRPEAKTLPPQDRAGFYSYDALERLFGADIHNADTIRAEWQHRAAGDHVPATQAGYLGGVFGERPGWRVSDVRPCRALVLENWGAFVVLPDGPDRSRLLVRSRMGGRDAPVAGAALSFVAFELPHLIMERGMLRGIRQRAESPRGWIGASPCAAAVP